MTKRAFIGHGALCRRLFVGGILLLSTQMSVAAKPPMGGQRAVSVTAQGVQFEQMNPSLSLIGKLESYDSVTITSQIARKISAILVKSNEQVSKDQLLVTLDSKRLQAAFEQAKATYNDEKRILAEYQKLMKRKAITQTEHETQQAKVDVAKASLDIAQSDLDETKIRAPFAGVIGLNDLSLGEYVTVGQPLLYLDDTSKMQLDLDVPEQYIANTVVGLKVLATTSAYPTKIFTGVVKYIDSRVNPDKLSVKVRVLFDNTKGANSHELLKPGMLMNAKLLFKPHQALVVPAQAVEYVGTERFVYRVIEHKAIKTKVTLGQRLNDQVVVESGLSKGDLVVVEGVVNMREGISVKVLNENAIGSVSEKGAN